MNLRFYREPEPIPVPDINDTPHGLAVINQKWLSHILSALEMLRHTGAWEGTDEEAYEAVQQIERLAAQLNENTMIPKLVYSQTHKQLHAPASTVTSYLMTDELNGTPDLAPFIRDGVIFRFQGDIRITNVSGTNTTVNASLLLGGGVQITLMTAYPINNGTGNICLMDIYYYVNETSPAGYTAHMGGEFKLKRGNPNVYELINEFDGQELHGFSHPVGTFTAQLMVSFGNNAAAEFELNGALITAYGV